MGADVRLHRRRLLLKMLLQKEVELDLRTSKQIQRINGCHSLCGQDSSKEC